MLKKLFIITAIVIIAWGNSFAQCMHDSTNIIGVNLGLGVYNIVLNDKGYNSSNNGRTGEVDYTLTYDRGITDRLTIGGFFRYRGFLLAPDTNVAEINVAYGFDFCVDGAFHFVRSRHVDLYIGADLGFGYIKLADDNLSNQGVFTAGGIAYGLTLGSRFYIGNHVGITFNFGYAGYEYPNGLVRGGGGYTDHWSLFFTGSTYTLGLCYRI